MKLKNQKGEYITYFEKDEVINIPEKDNKKEVKGLWVSNVFNIDFPTTEDQNAYENKIEELFETTKKYHINTLFFQVRTTNDAFYKSKLNPYSRFYTGHEGKTPQKDYIKLIIEKAHKENIKIHAWCNPYRVSGDGKMSVEEYLATCDDLNFAKQHPETLVLDTNGKLILNPGNKLAQQHILDSMKELINEYDFDGIHFDDYFYPYAGLKENHDDTPEYQQQELSLGDFRRDNVNKIIKGVYEIVKEKGKHLEFGVSPFGIWKNNKENEFGSNTSTKCSESYYGQYADSLTWIKEGYIDYICPQVYWEFNHAIAPFADIVDFWGEVCEQYNVGLYIGHAAYRIGVNENWEDMDELKNQILYTHQYESVTGNIFFTYRDFINEEKEEGLQKVIDLFKE